MSHIKRRFFIVCLACLAVILVFYLVWMFNPAGLSLLEFVRANPVVLVLLTLVVIPVLVGFAFGLFKLINSYTHARETLEVGEGGSVSIETSALVSTARRAIENIEDVAIQNVAVDVIRNRGDVAMDVRVAALPRTSHSLMDTAAQIQAACKESLESFTDHKVRYVSVDYIDSKRRSSSPRTPIVSGTVTPIQNENNQAVSAEADTPQLTKELHNEPSESNQVIDEVFEQPSLLQRIKNRFGQHREDQDVIESSVDAVEEIETKPLVYDTNSLIDTPVATEEVTQALDEHEALVSDVVAHEEEIPTTYEILESQYVSSSDNLNHEAYMEGDTDE